MIRAYFFDVDGTLVDSAPDICAATAEVCRRIGTAPISEADIRRYIGRSLAEMFADFYPKAGAAEMACLIALYRQIYPLRAHAGTRVFPGVPEMLAALPGRKSTATTKSSATTAAMLEQFGLRAHFDHIQGSDNGRYKPDPAILLEAMDAMQVRPEECMMVGDATSDIEAGRRAGVRTCAVAWGYGDPAELRRLEPDLWIDRPMDLVSGARQLGG